MDAKDLDEFEDEELEMLINGIIHPTEMFTPPDFGSFAPVAGLGGMPGGSPIGGMPGGAMPSGNIPSPFTPGSLEDLMTQEWDEEDESK